MLRFIHTVPHLNKLCCAAMHGLDKLLFMQTTVCPKLKLETQFELWFSILAGRQAMTYANQNQSNLDITANIFKAENE